MVKHADGRVHHIVELTVGDQYLGFAMREHKGDGLGIQAHVEGIEYRANHRHAKMRFEHGRDVGQHDGHGVVLPIPRPARAEARRRQRL